MPHLTMGDLQMPERSASLNWVLDRAVQLEGDRVATIDLGTGERRTWDEVSRRVDGITAHLAASALDPGDRVGVLALNSARHLELWFAIPASGLVMNDLNYRLAPEELRFICADCQVKALFVDETFLPVARQIQEVSEHLETLIWMGVGTDAPEGTLAYDELAVTGPAELREPVAEDLAAIFYTGGTTGLPKGAMLTHRNLTSNAMHMIASARLTSDDLYMHAAPQFHLADGAMSFSITWVGGTHVFLPAFEPGAFIDALAAEDVTICLIVPTMVSMTLHHGGLVDADLSALRVLMYGASPMPAEVQRRAQADFGCDLIQAYGMTEASPLVTYLSEDAHRKGGAGIEPWATRLRSAGSPVIGVRVEVRDEDAQPVPAGTPGEIYVQGPNIMTGYWNREEETAHALVDGWYRSGDVAYADEAGFLFIVDRAKDMIISGGENIYTTEVENAIYSLAGVGEAAVFGIPDEQYGETVHAEIVPTVGAGFSEDDVIEHCRTLIAGYKMPRSVTIRAADDPLPKSGAGKILKTDLREPYWEGIERRVG